MFQVGIGSCQRCPIYWPESPPRWIPRILFIHIMYSLYREKMYLEYGYTNSNSILFDFEFAPNIVIKSASLGRINDDITNYHTMRKWT